MRLCRKRAKTRVCRKGAKTTGRCACRWSSPCPRRQWASCVVASSVLVSSDDIDGAAAVRGKRFRTRRGVRKLVLQDGERMFGGVTKAQTKRRKFTACGVEHQRACLIRRKNETKGLFSSTDSFARTVIQVHAVVQCHCPLQENSKSTRHAGHRQVRLQRQKNVYLSRLLKETRRQFVGLSPEPGILCRPVLLSHNMHRVYGRLAERRARTKTVARIRQSDKSHTTTAETLSPSISHETFQTSSSFSPHVEKQNGGLLACGGRVQQALVTQPGP